MVGNDPRYDPQEVRSFDIRIMYQPFALLAFGSLLSGSIVPIERSMSSITNIVYETKGMLKIVKYYAIEYNPFKLYARVCTRTKEYLRRLKVKSNIRKRKIQPAFTKGADEN